jgi:uncharacterized membrane protein
MQKVTAMKRLFLLIKTTIIGGLIFLVPIIIMVAILGKAYELMIKVAKPFSAWIPLDAIGGVALANFLAVLAILLCCLIAGFIAKGSCAKRILNSLESKLLLALPGYSFVKGMTDSMKSSEEAAKSFVPVVAKFDDNAQIGFEIERTEKGNVVVYLPGSPNPWSGSVVYVNADRVERLDMTVPDAINNIRHLGRGSAKYAERVGST